MDVVRGRQAGTDVKQLRDAGLADQVAHHAAEHGTLRLHADLDFRDRRDDLVAERPVGGEIVLTAEQVVIDPRHVRTGRIKPPGGNFTSCHRRIVPIRPACVRRPSE
jgi:hypothetical protein